MKTLKALLIHELQDLYSAETQLLQALPKLADSITDEEVKMAIQQHVQETRSHVERLEQIAELLEVALDGETCEAMEGLLTEAKEIMGMDAPAPVKDAALIAAAQRVEHYEIAWYGTAQQYAETLGLSRASQILQTTLDEEKQADQKLNGFAINKINKQAERV